MSVTLIEICFTRSFSSLFTNTVYKDHKKFVVMMDLDFHISTTTFVGDTLSGHATVSGVRVSHKVHGSDSDIDDGGWFV
jgi:hypothetical protein